MYAFYIGSYYPSKPTCFGSSLHEKRNSQSCSTDKMEIIHADPPTVQQTTPHKRDHCQSRLEINVNQERWLYIISLDLTQLSADCSFRSSFVHAESFINSILIFHQVWEWLVHQSGTGTILPHTVGLASLDSTGM